MKGGDDSGDEQTSSSSGRSRGGRRRETPDERIERLNRLARGEANSSDMSGSSSSSSSGSESDSEDDSESNGQTFVNVTSSSEDDEGDDAFFREAEEEQRIELNVPEGHVGLYNENLRRHEAVERLDDATSRLAVVNLDWDRVRAVDLHSLLQSFLSGTGTIKRVSIYPSQFGMERMAHEEQFGPQGIYNEDDASESSSSSSSTATTYSETTNDDRSAGGVDTEKLRMYEMDKLRYYFAVVECNTVTASKLSVPQCDGLEYESSSLVLDLRFIPDSVTFDQKARSSSAHLPENYKPPDFSVPSTSANKCEVDMGRARGRPKSAVYMGK